MHGESKINLVCVWVSNRFCLEAKFRSMPGGAAEYIIIFSPARRANLSRSDRLRRRANHWLKPARLAPDRRGGVSRSSRTLGAGCDGRFGSARRALGLERAAKSCGPDLPTLGSSLRVTRDRGNVARRGYQPAAAISCAECGRCSKAGAFISLS